jgi:peptide/nickel transport system permease protein
MSATRINIRARWRLWPGLQRPSLVLALAVIILCLAASLFGPWLMPADPTDFITDDPFGPPSHLAWLGTDYMGRDILSRLIDGTRLTLAMAAAAAVLAHLLGDTLGLLAAVCGGWVDALLSRLMDVVLSLPKIIVGLVVVAALGPSLNVIVAVAACVYAAGVFRLARALGADLVGQDFVGVARARGEGLVWIIGGEILPHVARPLLADFVIRLGFAILFLSSLSFLGLGVQPPMADWGGLVRENLQGLAAGSWAPVFPALAIAALAIALNLAVDAVGEQQDETALLH